MKDITIIKSKEIYTKAKSQQYNCLHTHKGNVSVINL